MGIPQAPLRLDFAAGRRTDHHPFAKRDGQNLSHPIAIIDRRTPGNAAAAGAIGWVFARVLPHSGRPGSRLFGWAKGGRSGLDDAPFS